MIRIKFCGLTSLADALSAVQAGADYLGFNFYPRSPRFITQPECAGIAAELKQRHPQVRLVGVFVNASAAEIASAMRDCALDLVQLHGDESPEFLAAVGPAAFKAVRGPTNGSARRFVRETPPAILLDAAVDGAYGGTGRTADWEAAAALARELPLLLAGGLRPDNVGQAVRRVQPWGVDSASGVESRPGSKDEAKMRAFVAAVRAAEVE
jgi:phosphoribosylanthranilate isomerase